MICIALLKATITDGKLRLYYFNLQFNIILKNHVAVHNAIYLIIVIFTQSL